MYGRENVIEPHAIYKRAVMHADYFPSQAGAKVYLAKLGQKSIRTTKFAIAPRSMTSARHG